MSFLSVGERDGVGVDLSDVSRIVPIEKYAETRSYQPFAIRIRTIFEVSGVTCIYLDG